MSESTNCWIKRFCSLDANEFLCEVDREFILDNFNLTGLSERVSFYKQALEIILDKVEEQSLDTDFVSNDDEDSSNQSNSSQFEYNFKIQILASAELLYGLIHARYILTEAGLQKMNKKYSKCFFGRCPRFYCEKAAMLPVGLSDEPYFQPMHLYCPRCRDIYVPHLSISTKYISIDGAYFGTNFPHMFFMMYPNSHPPKPTGHFTASLYGFKIHPLAYEYQQKMSISAKSCPMQLTKKGELICNGTNSNIKKDKKMI